MGKEAINKFKKRRQNIKRQIIEKMRCDRVNNSWKSDNYIYGK
jgi:hypothetical protein